MGRHSIHGMLCIVSRTTLRAGAGLFAGLLAISVMASDLSSYRDFAFGADLEAVTQRLSGSRHETKVLHQRPALIHELTWRPQTLGPSAGNRDSITEVTFTFLEKKLHRIEVVYDRYETKGMTRQDLVAAISEMYGTVILPEGADAAAARVFGDQGERLATWRDTKHCFELWQYGYGPTYKLVGWQLDTEAAFRAAIAEALRLDTMEIPEREEARAARVATDAKDARNASRTVNKPNFRP